jgi:GNAT superfamily N-acetyltransferase
MDTDQRRRHGHTVEFNEGGDCDEPMPDERVARLVQIGWQAPTERFRTCWAQCGSVDGVGAVFTARPMLESDLDSLATLFASDWSTRHCWCMAFCSTRRQFAIGWFGGGNARRFAAMTAGSSNAMGVLAFRDDEVVGWCACGPRSRYAMADTPRTAMIRERAPEEHAAIWFVPCFFVRDGHRGQGVTHTLTRAAVDLARREGAAGIEGWPISTAVAGSADAFVGREQVFEEVGFTRVARPSSGRVIMRLDLWAGPKRDHG